MSALRMGQVIAYTLPEAPVVVGLDLSLTAAGVAVVRPAGDVRLWTVGAKGHKGDSLATRRRRILDQYDAILDVLRDDLWQGANQDPADVMFVVEAPSLAQRAQVGTNDRAGLWWWVVGNLGYRWPVVEVAPSARAKYGAGRGNAPKAEVLASVVRRWPHLPVSNDNEADALVLAAMGARHVGHPIDNPAQTCLAAMTGVQWPTQEGQTT